MRLRTISYRETKTFGNYQNVTVEMLADVSEAENIDETFAYLKSIVQLKLAERIHAEERREDEELTRNEKGWMINDLENKIANLTAIWQRAKAFLEKHGVSIVDQDIPF